MRVEQLTRELAHSRAEAAWLRGAVKASQDQFATEVRSRRYIETSGRYTISWAVDLSGRGMAYRIK